MKSRKYKPNKKFETPKVVCYMKGRICTSTIQFLLFSKFKNKVVLKSSKFITFVAYKETTGEVSRYYYVPLFAFKKGGIYKKEEMNGKIPNIYCVGEYSRIKVTHDGTVLGKKTFADGTSKIEKVNAFPLNLIPQHSLNSTNADIDLNKLWDTASRLKRIKIRFKWLDWTK